MDKLGALDANFLYGETRRNMNQIASVQVMELPEGTSEDTFIAGLKDFLLERIHLVPYLTRRLQHVPFDYDHPAWVTDHAFSIDNHVVRVDLDAVDAGDFSAVERKVAELHSAPMNRDIPLWSIFVICGFKPGQVVYYNQVHHACVDGMAGQAATELLMDTSPDHPPVASVEPNWDNAIPGPMDLLQASFANLARFQAGALSRALGAMDAAVRVSQRMIDPVRNFGALDTVTPRTRFNQPITHRRSYATGELPLATVKRIGKLLDCTVNDVFMAITSGALRRYLERQGELPAQPLKASCPVSLRKPGDTSSDNQVTMMNVSLETGVADPAQRLLAIARSARVAKEVTADLAGAMVFDLALPGLPAAITRTAGLAEAIAASASGPVLTNVVISNVPGPRDVLYSNGARMLTHYPVSIPAHGAGLNITVQSYAGTLYFALTACAQALPDADVLRDDMLAAYNEVLALLPARDVTALPSAAEKREANAAKVLDASHEEVLEPEASDKVA